MPFFMDKRILLFTVHFEIPLRAENSDYSFFPPNFFISLTVCIIHGTDYWCVCVTIQIDSDVTVKNSSII